MRRSSTVGQKTTQSLEEGGVTKERGRGVADIKGDCPKAWI